MTNTGQEVADAMANLYRDAYTDKCYGEMTPFLGVAKRHRDEQEIERLAQRLGYKIIKPDK